MIPRIQEIDQLFDRQFLRIGRIETELFQDRFFSYYRSHEYQLIANLYSSLNK